MANYHMLLLPGDGIGPEVMAEVERLIEWVVRWVAPPGAPPAVVLVFAGVRPPRVPVPPPAPRLQLRFMDRAADDDLKRLIERYRVATLVSADGELVRFARNRGRDVHDPMSFFRELSDDLSVARERAEREPRLDADDVRFWSALFRGSDSPELK